MLGILGRLRRLCIVPGILAVSAGLCFWGPSFSVPVWQGYYTVLVDGEAEIGEIAAALEESGPADFVCGKTARVEISDFDKTETLSLGELPARLAPEDPRMDAFLKKAGGLFRSALGRQHILYFPAGEKPISLAFRLGRALEGRSWYFVEWHTGRRLALFLLFITVAAVFAYFFPRLRRLAFVFAFPWLCLPLYGRPEIFAGGILVYSALMFFLEETCARFELYLYSGEAEFWTETLKRRTVYGITAGGAASLLCFLSGGGALPLATGIVADVFLGLMTALRVRFRKARLEHRLFIPVVILPGVRPRQAGRACIPAALLCCLMAVPLVFRLCEYNRPEFIPAPAPVSGLSELSQKDMRDLWLQNRDRILPDFSGYLYHRAFQQGFFYGYPEEFPAPGSGVVLPRFREVDGVITQTGEALLTFDEKWYTREVEKAKEPGLGNLLLLQGASASGLEPVVRFSLDILSVFRYGSIIAPALAPLLFAGAFRASGPERRLKNSQFRRNQQEA